MAERIQDIDRLERPWRYPEDVIPGGAAPFVPGGLVGIKRTTRRTAKSVLLWLLCLILTGVALLGVLAMQARPALADSCTTSTPSPSPSTTETPAAAPTPTVSCTSVPTVVQLDPVNADVLAYGLGVLVLFTSAYVVAGWARGH